MSEEERRLMWTWKKQVEEDSLRVGLCRDDALSRSKWFVGINQIATRLRGIYLPYDDRHTISF